jgi:hypothetical protein
VHIFFLLILQFLFYSSQAISYQECEEKGLFNIIDNSESSNITGARGAECNITCSQRFLYDFMCYSDVGIYYDLWYWLFYILYIGSFIWSIYCSYIIFKVDNFKLKLSSQNFTILGTILTLLIRIIWLAGIYNGRTPDVFNGFVIFDAILVRSVQTLQLVLFMGIVMVWRNIINSTKYLKQIDKNQNQKLVKCVSIVYVAFAILILPISIIANLYMPRLNMIVGAVFGKIDLLNLDNLKNFNFLNCQ